MLLQCQYDLYAMKIERFQSHLIPGNGKIVLSASLDVMNVSPMSFTDSQLLVKVFIHEDLIDEEELIDLGPKNFR